MTSHIYAPPATLFWRGSVSKTIGFCIVYTCACQEFYKNPFFHSKDIVRHAPNRLLDRQTDRCQTAELKLRPRFARSIMQNLYGTVHLAYYFFYVSLFRTKTLHKSNTIKSGNFGPVSYTHLDVYKRQVITF